MATATVEAWNALGGVVGTILAHKEPRAQIDDDEGIEDLDEDTEDLDEDDDLDDDDLDDDDDDLDDDCAEDEDDEDL